MRSLSFHEGLRFTNGIFSWMLVALGSASQASSASTVASEVTRIETTLAPSPRSASSDNSRGIILFFAVSGLVALVCMIRRNPGCLAATAEILGRSFSLFSDLRTEQRALVAERRRWEERLELFREQNQTIISSELVHVSTRGYNYEPDSDTPDEFICPITREIMRTPVICNGRCYEYAAIKQWFDRGNHTDPMTRAELSDPAAADIDSTLRGRIAEYLIARPRVTFAVTALT